MSEEYRFTILSTLNILWIFLSSHVILVLLFLNLSILMPRSIPLGHTFVLDSAEYIDEIYYYGSGPEEIEEKEIQQNWVNWDITAS